MGGAEAAEEQGGGSTKTEHNEHQRLRGAGSSNLTAAVSSPLGQGDPSAGSRPGPAGAQVRPGPARASTGSAEPALPPLVPTEPCAASRPGQRKAASLNTRCRVAHTISLTGGTQMLPGREASGGQRIGQLWTQPPADTSRATPRPAEGTGYSVLWAPVAPRWAAVWASPPPETRQEEQ